MINPVAKGLNEQLEADYPKIWNSLSDLGRRIYFPKGILAQSQEANQKAKAINATIGISTANKAPMYLSTAQEILNPLAPKDLYPYAPAAGRPGLRALWQKHLTSSNPSLQGAEFSLPVVTAGITHGIALVAQMFLNPGEKVIVPELNWENYHLIFDVEREAEIVTYPLFNEQQKFNSAGLKQKLQEVLATQDKAVVVLNFPNNPTGYSLSKEEQDQILQVLKEASQLDKFLIVLCDDAYYGLFFEEHLAQESIFSKITQLKNDNILAVKLDGATKEYFMWGFRVGFITFFYPSLPAALYQVLEKKITGLVRAKISNCSHPAQSILEKVLTDDSYQQDAKKHFLVLQARALKVKEILSTGPYAKHFSYYPFNSGYFMCLKLHKIKSEDLRVKLLEDYQIGTISFNEYDLRIAFSSVEIDQLQEMFDKIFTACESF